MLHYFHKLMSMRSLSSVLDILLCVPYFHSPLLLLLRSCYLEQKTHPSTVVTYHGHSHRMDNGIMRRGGGGHRFYAVNEVRIIEATCIHAPIIFSRIFPLSLSLFFLVFLSLKKKIAWGQKLVKIMTFYSMLSMTLKAKDGWSWWPMATSFY